MEKTFDNNFFSKIDVKLNEKVSFANKHALSEKEYKEITEEELKFYSIRSKRKPTDKEIENFRHFSERTKTATIFVETIPEARRVMEILQMNPHQITDTLAHENAHGNKADELGAKHLGYKFLLINRDDGSFIIKPRMSYRIPDEWDMDKKNEMQRKITQAPKDYGNELSKGDEEHLGLDG